MNDTPSGVEILSSTTALTSQSWIRSAILRDGGHKLRATIRRNAYDSQSSAVIQRWDGAAWQEVASIPYPNMATCGTRPGPHSGHEIKLVSYVRPLDTDAHAAFDTDQAELVRLARLILD